MREQEHFEQGGPAPEPSWTAVRPLIDELLQQIDPSDSQTILLRFFEGRSFEELGGVLGIAPDTARMRVNRALDRLRGLLGKRGIKTTSAALSALLMANAVQAAPSLAISAVLAGVAGLAPVKLGILEMVIMTKTKIGIVGTILALGVATPSWLQYQKIKELREHERTLAVERSDLQAKLDQEREQLEAVRRDASELQAARGELARLRAEVTRLRAQPPVAAAAKPPTPKPSMPMVEAPRIPEAQVASFLAESATKKGQVLGSLRNAMVTRRIQEGDHTHLLELAKAVRPKLEALESQPMEFAAFQTEFVKNAIGLNDEGRIEQLRQLVETCYQEALAGGMTSASRPAEESQVEEWARKRNVLDRRATGAVQAMLTPEERERFDRAFLGIMGIDLGIGDGAMHRFTEEGGTVVFPPGN